MKKIAPLGEQEMVILKFISNSQSVTVGETAAHFEKERGIARTTVSTVMERLRKKGLLGRAKVDGVFHYSVKVGQKEILHEKVGHFIERTLGGSVGPLFHYLFHSSKLSDVEVEQLKLLAAKLDQPTREGSDV